MFSSELQASREKLSALTWPRPKKYDLQIHVRKENLTLSLS